MDGDQKGWLLAPRQPFSIVEAMITLNIAGDATGKSRPRFNSFTRRAITPKSNIISENDVRSIWREEGQPRIDDDVAIGIAVRIEVPRPRSHFKANGELSALGLRNPIPRNKKPDLDNAVKLVMDALNSRAYRDDVAIARLYCERIWGDWPRTIVKIFPLHEPVE